MRKGAGVLNVVSLDAVFCYDLAVNERENEARTFPADQAHRSKGDLS